MQKMINDKHSEADFHFSKLDSCLERNITDWGKIKTVVKDALSEFLWKRCLIPDYYPCPDPRLVSCYALFE